MLQYRNYYPSTAYNSHFWNLGIILLEVNAILHVIFTIIVVDFNCLPVLCYRVLGNIKLSGVGMGLLDIWLKIFFYLSLFWCVLMFLLLLEIVKSYGQPEKYTNNRQRSLTLVCLISCRSLLINLLRRKSWQKNKKMPSR